MNIGRNLRRLATPLLRRNRQWMAAYIYLRGLPSILARPRRSSLGFYLVGNDDMISGTYEPQETAVVQRLLKETDIFINIGANTGYYCAIALSQGVDTIAFEPVPQNLAMLYSTMSANHWQDRIEVHPIALGSSTGLADIFGYGTGARLADTENAADYLSMLVPVNTLDNILGSRLDGNRLLILIDAEGAEYEILRGATSLLSRPQKPTWLMEINPRAATSGEQAVEKRLADTFQLMWDHGYAAETIAANPRRIDAEMLKNPLNQPGKKLPYDFLFTPE